MVWVLGMSGLGLRYEWSGSEVRMVWRVHRRHIVLSMNFIPVRNMPIYKKCSNDCSSIDTNKFDQCSCCCEVRQEMFAVQRFRIQQSSK